MRIGLTYGIARHDEVITEPDGIVAKPLCVDDEPADYAGVAVMIVGGNNDPDLHPHAAALTHREGETSKLRSTSPTTASTCSERPVCGSSHVRYQMSGPSASPRRSIKVGQPSVQWSGARANGAPLRSATAIAPRCRTPG